MSHLRKFNDFIKESERIEDKKIIDVWKEIYGNDFVIDHPIIFKILKQRPSLSIDKRELKRIWNETYDEDLEKDYPEFYSKIS
jgi:hypothetical protein